MSITYARNAPLAPSDNRFASIPARLLHTAARQPAHPAYYVRDAAGWQATNWGDYAAQVRQAARALVAQGAEVVVLGCAGMAGHVRAAEDAAGVPVIEPCQAAGAAALLAVLAARGIKAR